MKGFVTAFLGVGALAAAAAGPPMAKVVSAGGALATAGGLLSTRGQNLSASVNSFYVNTQSHICMRQPEAPEGIRGNRAVAHWSWGKP